MIIKTVEIIMLDVNYVCNPSYDIVFFRKDEVFFKTRKRYLKKECFFFRNYLLSNSYVFSQHI